jgi:tRNA(Ile)-lysidine synthase
MHEVVGRVAGVIKRARLIDAGDRVAVAVSGGSDSVALLWLLHRVSTDLGFTLAGVVHVNHGLRGEDAAADEAFVQALASRLELPCEVAHVDVAALARARRQSIEVAAREARYAFFDDAAARLAATRVATGHTMDDQAETVLLRLLRGAGSRGVTGIRLRRGRVIRPVLDCRRADLLQYLAAIGEPYREDASNRDRAIARNRVRHELVPVIEQLAPGGVRALARFARLSGDDEAYLERVAIEAASFSVLFSGGGVEVKRGALAGLPPAIARRVVRRAVAGAAPDLTLAVGHLDAVRALAAADKPEGHLDLPGLAVERRGDVLTLAPRARDQVGHPRGPVPASYEYVLTLPGSVDVPEAGVTIAATTVPGTDTARVPSSHPDVAVVQAGSIAAPFAVRSRRPGDRLRPLGAPGRRKLQDVFVDRKVPRRERDRVPIVVDRAGRIVWVAGLTVADECRVTAPEAGMVILELKRR